MTEPHERVKIKRKDILLNNLLGGIAWSLGVTIGLTIVAAVLTMILNQISLVPVIGDFVTQITDFVENNSRPIR